MLDPLRLSNFETVGTFPAQASVPQIAESLLGLHRGPAGIDAEALQQALAGFDDSVRTAVEARLSPVERGELDRATATDAALAAGGSRRSPADTRATAIAFRRELDGNRETLASGAPMSAEARAARTEVQQAGELALLNVDVYNDVSDAALLPRGFTALSDAQVRAQFPGFKENDDRAGFYSRVYFDANTDRHVVVNRGTNDAHAVWGIIRGTPDGRTNGALLAGNRTRQAELAIQNARIIDRATDGRVVFSGHSLGGALASLQGTYAQKDATIFNPLGLNTDLFREYKINVTDFHANVRSYIVNGDPVNGSNGFFGLQRTTQSTVLPSRELTWSLNDGLRSAPGADDPHSMIAVIGGLLHRANAAK